MIKVSFKRSFTGTLRHAKRVLQTNQPLKQGLIGAALGGAYAGGVNHVVRKAVEKHGTPAMKKQMKDADDKHPFLRHPLTQTVMGAAIGGHAGVQLGTLSKTFRDAGKQGRGFSRGWRPGGEAPPPSRPSSANMKPPAWAKGAKTKADAKKAYRAEAFKHHPDRGGDQNKMKDLNNQWENFQQSEHFNKLSGVLPSFFDELDLIHAPSR